MLAPAQQVEPILSEEYLALIRKDSLKKTRSAADTINSIRNTSLRSLQSYNGYPIKKIVIRKGGLRIEPASSKVLWIGGHLSHTTEIKTINRVPQLQSSYVQGRSVNDQTVWRGPETNELFSFGPSIHTLSYDNSSYPYDKNGRLVPASSGQDNMASPYASSIFRTAFSFKQALVTNARYVVKGKQVLTASLKFGHGNERLFILQNTNRTHDFSASVEAMIKKIMIGGGYSAMRERFSNPNRNAFLNRVYQNSLLTPVSFDNTQGSILGNGQRSYSSLADNPLFLLEDNGNSSSGTQRRGNLHIGNTQGKLRVKLSQSAEHITQDAKETYKPGTAYFPNGIATHRRTIDNNYFLKANASQAIAFTDYRHRGSAVLNYIFSDNRMVIHYAPGNTYQYQRSSHDLSLGYHATYDGDDIDAGLNLDNKLYISNTTISDLFLPRISGYVSADNIFHCERLYAKLAGSLDYFNSEPPINRSFAQNSLLHYSTEQFFHYFPVTEIESFGGLTPVRTKEWQLNADITYDNRFQFSAEVFSRLTSDDVFLVYESVRPLLKNLATHRNRGIELTLTINPYVWRHRKISTSTSLSFHSYRSKVLAVNDGYDYTPIAGFTNVHKAVVKDQPLGALVGNSFVRDVHHRMVIGNDGFPIANPTPVVIGNPIPDFIIKVNTRTWFRKWLLNIDAEWKKGGDIWNGTQATLDYYGRSAGSGDLRHTTGYIFPGVTQDGHPNDRPVSFSDPRLPVEQNRWTRYGHGGIASEYVQKGDHLRINNIGLSYRMDFRKHIRSLTFGAYANNLIIWTPYKGADPNQLLLDQLGTTGLDFFNLPSLKTFGFSVTTQF